MEDLLDATRRWLAQVVVGLNLCPFSAGPLRAGRIRIVTREVVSWDAMLSALMEEIMQLDGWPPEEVATTLLLVPSVHTFPDLLDLIAAAEDLMDAMGVGERFQLVAFHPDFRFSDSDPADAGNLVNRSPAPTVHILRADDVAQAVASHPDVHRIPDENARRLRALGTQTVHALWETP